MSYSVGQVADFAGVTVRTLHHYDGIGLLVPGERSPAGHRRYSDADLDRLQQILFYRELGFPLEEVAVLLDDPDADPHAHLRRQHELLSARIEKLQKMAAAVEHAMEARRMGINLTPEEKFEVFGDFDPDAYEEEVQERWGNTDAYRQSQQRAASYTKEDWQRIQREADELTRRFVGLMEAGEPADSEAAMDAAEAHREGISRNHYECGHEMHTCLGEMYVNDERFTRNIDQAKPGLAAYMRDAILANAVRHTS
ncbi:MULTISPECIES: MerR family transcriptional regulator [unclassified Streptomyces]|uniref:MerR family transcriptional regulator n=1 Tax=unclassified Streptomyces TaxID=2593676 RepID=UPI000F6F1919|nr:MULTISPECIES: MerR family transcriptional regulator [unclassified Streptomyces]AZM60878.1 MerR family transcriptional regulator [Streptomyces sp. WAC 01438]RSM94555.1 MerR family transcriptional regulator [Streptomyces sp. WAC 01420]